jgi:CBS domain containing-hemolysin-like protein
MDISGLISYFFLLSLLLLCSAFFSGSETALSALTRTQIQRMRKDRSKSSTAIVHFLDDPRRLFITVLFGNTLVNMAFISIMGALIYDEVFQGRNLGIAYVTAILIETTLLLLIGEITPKTIAIAKAERFSRVAAPVLWNFSRIIFPFRRALRFFIDILLPFFGVHSDVATTPITGDEIRATVKATAAEGAIDEEEGEVLSNIFDLQDTKVKEIMIPRTQMLCVEVSTTIHEAFELAMQNGFSRLPVYRKRLDNICGIFNVKDLPRWRNLDLERLGKVSLGDLTLDDFISKQTLLNAMNPGQENTLIRPPFFVFKTRDIGTLMREMSQKKEQMGILLDEFGGVVGLATVEDMVEEVVGEIEDEYDAEPEPEIVSEPGKAACFLVPGSLGLKAFNKELNLDLDVTQADTVSGFVTHLAGSIPKQGDVLEDDSSGVVFEVLKMAGRRIDRLRVRLPKKPQQGSSGLLLGAVALIASLGISMPTLYGGGMGQIEGWPTLLVFSLLLAGSLFMSGFFSGSETAFVSASMARIDLLSEQSDRRALFIQRLMQEPGRMLGTVLVGNNLMNVAAGAAGLQLIRSFLAGQKSLQELANTLVMTLVILVFCEILPKTIFRFKADALALRSAPFLRLSELILKPLVLLFTQISDLVVNRTYKAGSVESARVVREELKLLAAMGEEEGALRKSQLRMVKGILDLEERVIGKIMTPLVEIVALSEDTSPDDFLQMAADTGFSRIPIFSERIDNIVGIVNVLDVLQAIDMRIENGEADNDQSDGKRADKDQADSAKDNNIKSDNVPDTILPFIRKDIRHEPESRLIFPLLKELTRSRSPMVFVVDEYGGVVGLVTIEDLVEEVMGEIWDEKDKAEVEFVQKISDRVFDCDGKTEVQVLIHDYGLPIPDGDYNTIAGFVIEKLQRIPRKGESLSLGKLRFLVLDADAKSVRRVRILKR